MDTFFYPQSVAVVGVSSSRTNLARYILKNLRCFRYGGNVYAVGPRNEEVGGFDVLPSVLDIEGEVDLAILLVPAKHVPGVAEECGRKGIKRLIIESGGFREFEGEGSGPEKELLEICRKYGIRFIGPNCIGVINRENGFCSPFALFTSLFHRGGISVITQSGGVGLSYAMELTGEYIGLSKFVSFGNGLDIDEVDLLEYLGRDEKTDIITAYLEGIVRGREFLRVASRLDKPIVLLKSNTQPMAHTIAASHSAAHSGDEEALEAALKQVGILRVSDSLVWASVSKQLTMPLMKGNRLAIFSRSGGHAVLATDAASKFGFDLPTFPDSFFEAVGQYFEKRVIQLQNPLDLGQIQYNPIFTHILEEALKLEEIDGALFIHRYDNQKNTEVAHLFIEQILPLMRKYNKPVNLVLYTQRDERQFVRENYRLPLFRTPFHAIQSLALSRDATLALSRRRPFDIEPVRHGTEEQRNALSQAIMRQRAPSLFEALNLLKAHGVSLAPYRLAHSREEALSIAEEMGYPITLKISHSDAPHKTEMDGVQLNLLNEYGVITGWDNIEKAGRNADLDGDSIVALVQKMSPQGWEMFVGAKRDISFGPVVIAGSGGVLAEVVRDVSLRVAPVTEEDAREMLSETRGSRLLEGFRDRGPADVDALVDLILTVSRVIIEHDEIEELDLNPVFVHPDGEGLTVVDARIVLKE